LGADDFEERERAAKELIEVGAPALAALRRAAEGTDLEVARRAKACIPEIERDEKVLAIVKELAATSGRDRARAIGRLSEFGAGAHKALPALMTALHDESNDVREAAIW